MSKTKLLLADDSITIQKVVSLTFADKGMDVVTFSDGSAAVEHLHEVRPDIVLADVHMPGTNGYQVCDLIRRNEATKDTPVVLLVGSFEPFDRDEADRVGANTHLTKPFTSIGDVVSTVERLLNESAASRKPEPPEGSLPDTSDIDNLYQRSFAETQELPEKASIEYELDPYDDEMIQTSYAEPAPGHVVEESLYPGDEGITAQRVEVEEVEAESLITESIPTAEEAVSYEREQPAEDVKPEVEETASSEQEAAEEAVAASPDPFESVADEPTPAQPDDAAASGPVSFSFEDTDLLELPDVPAAGQVDVANGREVVSLSPALVDLIVQKVVERLGEKNKDEAKSVSGS